MTFNKAKAIRPNKRGGLPRLCDIDCGKGEVLPLHLHSMAEAKLEEFWKMPLDKQVDFLREYCNHHHRLPRVCGGHTSQDNISIVPTEAHRVYNELVRLAAGFSGIDMSEQKWESKVQSSHIARALTVVYRVAKTLLSDPDTMQLDPPEKVREHFGECWLPESPPLKLGYRGNVPYFYTKKG